MPRIIVKCRYIKSAPAHRSNLVEYMATREGVDKEIDVDRPATKKQADLIERILRTAPDSRDMFEFEDYTAKPSAATASEFITQALEQNADRFADRKVFLEYIANRPRVQKLGAHGLFGDTDAPVNLAEVQREVEEHPGNVWTNVVSLRREDAERLGYDNATAWRTLMREHRNKIAESMKISADNFRWYAVLHRPKRSVSLEAGHRRHPLDPSAFNLSTGFAADISAADGAAGYVEPGKPDCYAGNVRRDARRWLRQPEDRIAYADAGG